MTDEVVPYCSECRSACIVRYHHSPQRRRIGHRIILLLATYGYDRPMEVHVDDWHGYDEEDWIDPIYTTIDFDPHGSRLPEGCDQLDVFHEYHGAVADAQAGSTHELAQHILSGLPRLTFELKA